ncbi:MAG: ABC transporter ATP-binding protein [Limnohabitans sp.]|nr:ABC transporter ATP-binding protein [Limnohabitans sp.]
MMLHIQNLTAGYGKVNVLHGISLDVYERECVALIGANGAGKSTTLRCICGLNEVRSGRIEFMGEQLNGLSGHAIVRKGITMCPEGRQVFAEMSVLENLEMGAHTRRDSEQLSDIERMLDLFPVLRQRAKQRAGTLSGGEQEMLAIARALMARPKLCIFDEPSLGLAPKIVEEVEQILLRIKAMGTTIVLVEQNAAMALRLADRAYVLEAGEVVLHGTGQELKNDPQVSKAYLGY